MFGKQLKVVAEGNNEPTNNSYGLQLPKYTSQDTIVAAVPKKVYANGLYILECMAILSLLAYACFIPICSSYVPYQLYFCQL